MKFFNTIAVMYRLFGDLEPFSVEKACKALALS